MDRDRLAMGLLFLSYGVCGLAIVAGWATGWSDSVGWTFASILLIILLIIIYLAFFDRGRQ